MKDENTQLRLSLRDEEWPFEYADHDREIVRAIVYDAEGSFYFVHVSREDAFGDAQFIETSGGGVESGEEHSAAILRELREELGAEAEIICPIGVVDDYYNLIHRHNINHYYLCRLLSLGEKHLTEDEAQLYHLSTLKLSYEQAVGEYRRCAAEKLGRLIANRELPVLHRAKELIDALEKR